MIVVWIISLVIVGVSLYILFEWVNKEEDLNIPKYRGIGYCGLCGNSTHMGHKKGCSLESVKEDKDEKMDKLRYELAYGKEPTKEEHYKDGYCIKKNCSTHWFEEPKDLRYEPCDQCGREKLTCGHNIFIEPKEEVRYCKYCGKEQ